MQHPPLLWTDRSRARLVVVGSERRTVNESLRDWSRRRYRASSMSAKSARSSGHLVAARCTNRHGWCGSALLQFVVAAASVCHVTGMTIARAPSSKPPPPAHHTHLLFFNDHALAQRDNVERRVGRPQLLSQYRDPHNLTMNWAFPSVLPCRLSSPRGANGFCMVYQGFTGASASQGWEGHPTAKFGLVAESSDGITWVPRDTRSELPDLPGRRFPNQVRPWDVQGYGGAVAESECTFVDPLAAGTPEHFKMLLSKTKYSPTGPNVTEYFVSSDAIHWEARTWPFLWHGQQVFGAFFNPLESRTTIIARPDGSDRRIVSHDVTWQNQSKTEPAWTLDTDSLDSPVSEVYGMPVIPYRGYFVAIPWILHPAQIPDATRPGAPVISGLTGKVDAQLAWGMDGQHWQRGLRTPMFSNGPPGSPTAGLVYPNSVLLPQEVGSNATGAITHGGEHILIFASASSVEHGKMVLDNGNASGSILVYELRRDGWVGLYSNGGVGTISTRVLEWGGGNLSLNVNAVGGEIHVQISDASNNVPLPGLAFADCETFTGDSTAWVPRWTALGALNSGMARVPPGLHIKVQIQLLDAELFSVSGNFIINRRYANSGAGLDPGYWQFHNGSHNEWPPPPPVHVSRSPMNNTDLSNGQHAIRYIYRHFTNKTAGALACQHSCDGDNNCTAWTYVTRSSARQRERCCLHGSLACPLPRQGMISGAKVDGATCASTPTRIEIDKAL